MRFDPLYFRNEEHKEMYYDLIKDCDGRVNCEVASVMYLLALIGDKNKIKDCFDFEKMLIRPQCLKKDWQYSSSKAACRLAFILWNGFPSERSQKNNNIYNFFGCGWEYYFIEAIRIRYC